MVEWLAVKAFIRVSICNYEYIVLLPSLKYCKDEKHVPIEYVHLVALGICICTKYLRLI